VPQAQAAQQRLKRAHVSKNMRLRHQTPRSSTCAHKKRAAGNGLGTTANCLCQTAAAGNRLALTIKNLHGASVFDLCTTSKYRNQCLCVDPELPLWVHKHNPHQHTFPFASAAQNNIPI